MQWQIEIEGSDQTVGGQQQREQANTGLRGLVVTEGSNSTVVEAVVAEGAHGHTWTG